MAGPCPSANITLGRASGQLVGDYANPILKPEAAAVVKRREMSLAGAGYPSPRNQCWPQGVPFIFTNDAVQLLQQPDKITMLYDEDHEVRRVRLNQPHPAQVTPSWYGDSVGRYEGDTLVIDTVGFKIRWSPRSTIHGAPFTRDLRVVERYRLVVTKPRGSTWGVGERRTAVATASVKRERPTPTTRARD